MVYLLFAYTVYFPPVLCNFRQCWSGTTCLGDLAWDMLPGAAQARSSTQGVREACPRQDVLSLYCFRSRELRRGRNGPQLGRECSPTTYMFLSFLFGVRKHVTERHKTQHMKCRGVGERFCHHLVNFDGPETSPSFIWTPFGQTNVN